jgi:hypothetical protein
MLHILRILQQSFLFNNIINYGNYCNVSYSESTINNAATSRPYCM